MEGNNLFDKSIEKSKEEPIDQRVNTFSNEFTEKLLESSLNGRDIGEILHRVKYSIVEHYSNLKKNHIKAAEFYTREIENLEGLPVKEN